MKGVLVTGASTGIGFATAIRLARGGFHVYAGVRADSDAQRLLAAGANIEPLLLDVCDARHIERASETIRAQGRALAGLVNNAGIAVVGPLEYLSLDDLRKQFDVNVFGAIAVTQTMLPLLREARGRIVFVSSVSGQIAPPFFGPYAASKFALEALCDSMRMELSAFDIPVSVIQPGNVKTPIWKKGRDAQPEMMARLSARAMERYGVVVDSFIRLTQREEENSIDPDDVARAIELALTQARPRARYAVGDPPAWQRKIAALLPERLRDKLILKNFQIK